MSADRLLSIFITGSVLASAVGLVLHHDLRALRAGSRCHSMASVGCYRGDGRMLARSVRATCRAAPNGCMVATVSDDTAGDARELILGALDGEQADLIVWDDETRRWRRSRARAASTSRLELAWQLVSRPVGRLLLMGTDTVTPDYYRFTKWRMVQRLLSAIKDVFATQALLGALGVRADGARGGVGAAGAWVSASCTSSFTSSCRSRTHAIARHCVRLQLSPLP